MAIDESDLPKLASPARRALAAEGITRLAQLTEVRQSDLARLHGIGPNALKTLRQALEAEGMAFADEGQRKPG